MPKEHLKDSNKLLYNKAKKELAADTARGIVDTALASWHLPSEREALKALNYIEEKFPNDEAPEDFWHRASSKQFRDFFTWGHDHDFGHGISRAGAMGERHTEITSEAIQMGFLPTNLENYKVLDIGCWSGGDLLILAGMGGLITATEEHQKSAESARELMKLLNCPTKVIGQSLYDDRSDWRQSFDIIYCSGVLYHVTDPLLLLRICFSYLRPGGRLIIETKAWTDNQESACHYSGSSIKGWNFYAPTELALARWFFDVGFPADNIQISTRPMKRFLACARKEDAKRLIETAGFSRPGSWLEGEN